MWERMNEDYITRQEEKNKLREAREQAQAQGQPPPGKKPKPRKKSSKKMARLGNQTAAEAVLDVVEKKRFSKKNQLHLSCKASSAVKRSGNLLIRPVLPRK